jgi:hypothetical protein
MMETIVKFDVIYICDGNFGGCALKSQTLV